MAFTSETVLKFGTTPVSFVVITLLDYALENEKAGAFDYRRKEKISLQGIFSNRESSVPIAEHFRQVKLLLESSTDFVDIKLNDKSYGKARFLGFSFPTSVSFDENSVRFSKINIQLEILKDDSSGAFSTANLPSSVSALSTIWYKLKNFTESFSFRVTDENYFEATHDVSFGLDNIDKNTNAQVVLLANQVANIFFAQGLDALSRIRPFYSPTNFQISALDYGSSQMAQTVDLINYTFAYSKQYKVLSANNSSSSETITTEISYKENGILEVVEKGRIKGNGASYTAARMNAIARLDVNLAAAYTRCNEVFTRYLTGSNYSTSMSKFFPKYNTTDALKTTPIAITKDLSEFGPEIGYEIRFTTDQSIGATRIHSYSISLNKNPQGIYEATVDGSIKYYTNKNRTFNSKISDIKSIIDTDDNTLINVYYPSVAGAGLTFGGIKTASSLNHLKFGVETTYSKSYSNSPTLIASGNLIRQVLISENISLPVNQFSTVVVPGYFNISPVGTFTQKTGKEAIYQTRQLTVGAKNISLNMKVDRGVLFNSGIGVNLLVDTVFSNLKTLIVDKMVDKTNGYLFGTATPAYAIVAFSKIYNEVSASTGDLTWFLEDLKISVDSSYNVKADLVFKFLLKKETI